MAEEAAGRLDWERHLTGGEALQVAVAVGVRAGGKQERDHGCVALPHRAVKRRIAVVVARRLHLRPANVTD